MAFYPTGKMNTCSLRFFDSTLAISALNNTHTKTWGIYNNEIESSFSQASNAVQSLYIHVHVMSLISVVHRVDNCEYYTSLFRFSSCPHVCWITGCKEFERHFFF